MSRSRDRNDTKDEKTIGGKSNPSQVSNPETIAKRDRKNAARNGKKKRKR